MPPKPLRWVNPEGLASAQGRRKIFFNSLRDSARNSSNIAGFPAGQSQPKPVPLFSADRNESSSSLEQNESNGHEKQQNSQPWGSRPDPHLAGAEPHLEQMAWGRRRGRF